MTRMVVGLAVVALVGLTAVTAHALPVTVIDFEDRTDSEPVTTQYPGLTFSNTTALTAGISLNELDFPPASDFNVVFDDGGGITIAFSVPVSALSGFFTYGVPLTITALDDLSMVVDTATSAFSSNLAGGSGDLGSAPNEFLSVASAGGISSVTIEADALGSSFTLDDLAFTPIPEPTTLFLFATGLAGIVGWRKVRRRISTL